MPSSSGSGHELELELEVEPFRHWEEAVRVSRITCADRARNHQPLGFFVLCVPLAWLLRDSFESANELCDSIEEIEAGISVDEIFIVENDGVKCSVNDLWSA